MKYTVVWLQGAQAGPAGVRQRRPALTHPRGGPAAPARRARRGRGRALLVSRLDRRALDRALRPARGGSAHARLERAASDHDAREPPSHHA